MEQKGNKRKGTEIKKKMRQKEPKRGELSEKD